MVEKIRRVWLLCIVIACSILILPGGAAAQAAGLCAELVVSNDVTPLLLAAPPEVGHVIAVCGTGTAFLATNGRSAPARVGGCEYLGSDEGSAFDLGLRRDCAIRCCPTGSSLPPA